MVCLQEVKTKFFTTKDVEGRYRYRFNTEEKYVKDTNEKLRKTSRLSKWGTGIGVRNREKKPYRYLETGDHRFAALVWDETVMIITVYLPCNKTDN